MATSRQSLPVEGWFPWTILVRIPTPLLSILVAPIFQGAMIITVIDPLI